MYADRLMLLAATGRELDAIFIGCSAALTVGLIRAKPLDLNQIRTSCAVFSGATIR
jgi:hypothetical protein